MINLTRASTSARVHLVGLHLRMDKEKPHNFRLFGADQCIVWYQMIYQT